MLLLHQTGSVKIGEVVRYTITYTPADDRILPSPPHLYLKIKNTSAIALRAAFVHGPYTLYVSSSPSTFRTNEKLENPRRGGVPEFEPNLKAGATWQSQLLVPESIRHGAGSARSHTQHQSEEDEPAQSVSWVVEVASQVIFSNSAAVHYEILLGRDEKSLSLGFGGLSGGSSSASCAPGHISDHQQNQGAKDGRSSAQPKGVFSRAIKVGFDDTASLWNTPKLPEWDDEGKDHPLQNPRILISGDVEGQEKVIDEHRNKRQKKVHLVVLTHGLHSNLGADMLYMKESIDAAAQQAKKDAKVRRAKRSETERRAASENRMSHDGYTETRRQTSSSATKAPSDQIEENTDEAEDDEEVIVRGFSGNAVRTEKGIKYLGKRLAKYVLAMTYPDQPFKPILRSTTQSFTNALKSEPARDHDPGHPVHSKSTIINEPYNDKKLAYKITSISFIAHSLGGLIQTYAIAYIQKHSPQFFDLIEPINFITLASPFLGLSNENPMYVKFALDFGFVGRTGQDLGLTWRAPTLARSGWGAIVGGIGESAHKKAERQQDPGSKPLLRILPTGPAHVALKKFRNRTVYSNVVNDGIVPLRTSCLLFLDWQGLGRVEKARRENGLVGTMAGWGWAELTGSNARASSKRPWLDEQEGVDSMDEAETNTPTRQGKGNEVPQPSVNEANEADDDARSLKMVDRPRPTSAGEDAAQNIVSPTAETSSNTGAIESILALFRSNPSSKAHNHTPKLSKIYKRSQTIRAENGNLSKGVNGEGQAKATRGEAASDDTNPMSAPPKTTFFEAAGDLLNPPIPPMEFLIDPSARPRTIFHDRVYHPDDIPPPPLKSKSTSSLARRISKRQSSPISLQSRASTEDDMDTLNSRDIPKDVIDGSAMKVEEKIARAYHRDLSWRKVLVRLEPDAHNNMIVRRRFANAYGWPVVKHLCDTHFSDQAVALIRDDDEGSQERAMDSNERPTRKGDEIKASERGGVGEGDGEGMAAHDHHAVSHLHSVVRTDSENVEARDQVPALNSLHPSTSGLSRVLNPSLPSSSTRRPSPRRPSLMDRQDSAQWSDRDFMDSDGDSDGEGSHHSFAVTSSAPNKPTTSAATATSGSGGWNWTEVIAGKGATSPRIMDRDKTKEKERDDYLGRKVEEEQAGGDSGVVGATASTAAAAGPAPGSRSATTVGLTRSLSSKRGEEEKGPGPGFVEQVARLSLGSRGSGVDSGEGKVNVEEEGL